MKNLLLGIFLLCALGLKAQTYVKIPFLQPGLFTVSASTINKSIESGATIQLGLDVEINGGSGHYSFSWVSAGNNLGTSPTIIVSQPGSYTLSIQDGSGCESQVVYVVNTNTGVADVLNQKLNIFPNPASNVIFLQSPDLNKLTRVSLYSLAGELVRNCVLENKSAAATAINLEGIQDGQYLLTCMFGNERVTRIVLIKSPK
jgi:hypothetical protein